MNTAHVSVCISPLADFSLFAEDAPIMAGIPSKIDPLAVDITTLCPGKKVDVPAKMPRCVNYVQATVPEQVNCPGEMAKCPPRSEEVDLAVFTQMFRAAFSVRAWKLNCS